VADNEPINHMNAPNLAICVAPVIITSAGPTSFAGTMESMGRAQALVRDLIMQCEWFFERDEEVEEEKKEEAMVQITEQQEEETISIPAGAAVDPEESQEGSSEIRLGVSI
jgi:hypothetical protein